MFTYILLSIQACAIIVLAYTVNLLRREIDRLSTEVLTIRHKLEWDKLWRR